MLHRIFSILSHVIPSVFRCAAVKSIMSRSDCVTLAYKHLADTDVHFDVYLPFSVSSADLDKQSVPAVVYFHGGGLTVGDRQSWFPKWLHDRATTSGYAFISADYQLMPPATGHAVTKDIQDLLRFIANTTIWFPSDPNIVNGSGLTKFSFNIDSEAIAVAGSSAGGLCAYLAAMHCVSPKPKAILSLYGQGGDFLTSHYVVPKTKPFLRGREILDPNDFLEFLHPASSKLETITGSPLKFHPQSYRIPGYPANPRMLIGRLYLQLGTFLDYYTGEHDPSLSRKLREALDANSDVNDSAIRVEKMRDLIPEHHRSLFPQFNVTSSWPATLLCHGIEDSAVLVRESRNLQALLESVNVPVKLVEFAGEEHSFDYVPDAEDKHRTEYDNIWATLRAWIEEDKPIS